MKKTVAVIGMGFVGNKLTDALSKGREYTVIGFDTDSQKIDMYKQGIDPTCIAGHEKLKNSAIKFTHDELDVTGADIYIVTDSHEHLKSASRLVGRHLYPGNLVIYETMVYPGMTENICKPILEEVSTLKAGTDFMLAYSPERLNLCDSEATLANTVKLVAGYGEEALCQASALYEGIVCRVHKVSSIKAAEASKMLESYQPDVNLAFVNELAVIFDALGIEMDEVLAAARTKSDFVDFRHCPAYGHAEQLPLFLNNKALRLLLKNAQAPK